MGRPKGKIQNTKLVHLGGGPRLNCRWQTANLHNKKDQPTGPTQQGCHMDPCCATAKRACVLSISLTKLLIVCGPCPQFRVTHGHRHVPRKDELCRLPYGPPASNSMSPYPTILNAAIGSAMVFTSIDVHRTSVQCGGGGTYSQGVRYHRTGILHPVQTDPARGRFRQECRHLFRF